MSICSHACDYSTLDYATGNQLKMIPSKNAKDFPIDLSSCKNKCDDDHGDDDDDESKMNGNVFISTVIDSGRSGSCDQLG